MRLFRTFAATTVALSAALLGSSQALAVEVSPQASAPAAVAAPGADYTGIAALSNCSGSLVRYAESLSTDSAMILTNGHCYEGGMPGPGVVITNRSSTRSFTLLKPTSANAGTVRANRVIYSTMTKTDVTLYRLTETYAAIKTRLNVTPLTLAKTAPANGAGMAVVSGYWKRIYTCSVQSTIPELREGGWVFKSSIKYRQPGCEIIGGTSGSPIVSTSTGEVIGVNNTSNEDGASCTLNNPCEVDANGNITVQQGAAYGQQTWWFYTCLSATRTLDLNKAGCLLAH
ncbi:serine protease [Streptomyces sp. SID13031]|uniref:S1 family peptidase n=1 Tax=Streptomyces sp. SID13031 TaxID=2706046 RepID=UPI0013C6B8E0|nr:serine protease [Streptomyces sp. SID13031]NEA36608.1 trypsin-like peptidase domain-containing protein [Streptomyces sp. SID13031]